MRTIQPLIGDEQLSQEFLVFLGKVFLEVRRWRGQTQLAARPLARRTRGGERGTGLAKRNVLVRVLHGLPPPVRSARAFSEIRSSLQVGELEP